MRATTLNLNLIHSSLLVLTLHLCLIFLQNPTPTCASPLPAPSPSPSSQPPATWGVYTCAEPNFGAAYATGHCDYVDWSHWHPYRCHTSPFWMRSFGPDPGVVCRLFEADCSGKEMGELTHPGTGDLEWLTNVTAGGLVLWRNFECAWRG